MDKYEIEFVEGRKVRIPYFSDAIFEMIALSEMGWRKGEPFPPFTIYKNGEECGGGGDK